jgi:SAM-dependent methyltransferase
MTAAVATATYVRGRSPEQSALRASGYGLVLRCLECGGDLDEILPLALLQPAPEVRCSRCAAELQQRDGIWEALPAKRAAHYERFIREYEIVRTNEGRGSKDAPFYLVLPYRDLTRRNEWQWRIRGRSFVYLERKIFADLERRRDRPLVILDLGAGNCWMSYRLALRGHLPVAVDLLTNEFDGLGAATHYLRELREPFPRFRAEADRLPLADKQCDVAVFNASFHYSEDYSRTLGEAIRCLRPGGTIVIVDSPWYSKGEFGQKMVAERREEFRKRFGFPSDGLASLHYLTDERLNALSKRFGIRWTVYCPWYGLRWAARPWAAKLKGRREPAEFRIFTAERPKP